MTKKLTTLRAIAEANGIGRNLVSRLWKLDGAPKKNDAGAFDSKACTEFILKHSTNEKVLTSADPNLRALKAAEIKERTRKLKIGNDIRAGLLIPRMEHESIIVQMSNAVQKVMASLPSRMAVEVVGLTVPEAEIRLQHAVNECLIALRNYKD